MNLPEVCAELEEHLELIKGYIGRATAANDITDLDDLSHSNRVQVLYLRAAQRKSGSLGAVAELGDVLYIVVQKHIRLLIEHGKLLVQTEPHGTHLHGLNVYMHFDRLERLAKERLP